MGDPKKQRKKYETPGHPWQKERLETELIYMGRYGLRNKRELWKHRTQLGKLRKQARSLLALTPEERAEKEKQLIQKAHKLGLVPETATLDDILSLTLDDILERRLQTIVLRKGLAKTIYHARQLITHGHIAIGTQAITSPGHIVTIHEENQVTYTPNSPYNTPNHPEKPQTTTETPA
ncbi:MAG: 30S ribosomal protein S4 [Candidatus Odinarchaeia archaeon]